jgi:hypothetical protein
MERVVGERGDPFGFGRQRQAERSGGGFCERGHESPVGAPSLVAGDLLLHDHGDQALGEQTRARDPQTSLPPPDLPDQSRRRIESRVVVLFATPGRRPVEHPGGARTPRLDVDPAASLDEPDRDGPVWGPGRALGDPAPGSHRRIAAAALQRSERLAEIDRALGRDESGRHDGQATPCDARGRLESRPADRRRA